MRLASLLLLALATAGCVTTPTPTGMLPPTHTWSRDIKWGVGGWRWELERRFGPCVIVDVHGGTDPATGKWAFWPDDSRRPLDADSVAWVLRKLYPPETPIILISCNASGQDLHVAGVWYAKDLVTALPWLPISGDVNNPADFIEGKP